MKKFIASILLLVFIVCFCSCNNTSSHSIKLLKEGNICNVVITSWPEYYEYSFIGDDARDIAYYLSKLNLSDNYKENPTEGVGMTWVISLEYENGDTTTVYQFGNSFIRTKGGPWYKMNIDEALRFNTLLDELEPPPDNNDENIRIWDQHHPDDIERSPYFSVNIPELNNAKIEYKEDGKIYVDGEHLLGGTGHGCESLYLSDLTGDGYPELCFVMNLGSGIVDTRIEIFDYNTKSNIFSLSHRGYHDYYLFLRDGVLCVKETEYRKHDAVRTGILTYGYDHLGISILWNNEINTDVDRDVLTVENGKHLVLPISKSKVYVRDQYKDYLDKIDLNLLKKAEEKITQQTSQYEDTFGFDLQVDSGHLYLCTEVIVDIEPPKSEGGEIMGGCNIDHEHKFFREKITH